MRWPLLLALVAVSAFAADAGAPSPSPKPDAGTAAAPAKKPKPVFMIFEDQASAEKFIVLKPAERAKAKGVLTKVTIGKRALAAIMLEDYELPFSRRVDLTADITITDPTGRVVLDKASVAAANTMDPKTMTLVPLSPGLGLMYGLTDPEGDYKVHLVIWDQVRGESTTLDTKFPVSR